MPHVDVKFDPRTFRVDQFGGLMERIANVVGEHFEENPEYVSVEVMPQSGLALNRKHIDIEVNSSPDAEGRRVAALGPLGAALTALLLDFAAGSGVPKVEVSAFCRVFAAGHYEFASRS